jgi:MFS transporter, PHS family, inorganic phosphate transporter
MGYAGDILGRNKAMLFTLTLASVGALLSALVTFGDPATIYSLIITCRFILGIGLGGVYPLSATKAAEDGAEGSGHASIMSAAWSFFWQCPGAMAPWLIAYIFTYFNWSSSLKWRLLLGIGFLPGIVVALASYYEAKETVKPVDTKKVDVLKYLADPAIRHKLIVTGGGWFLYDICYCKYNKHGYT